VTRLSFNGDEAIKYRYFNRLRDHIERGNFRFSPVWESGKGSAVGCTIEADDVDTYADHLGIPIALASVLDNLVCFQDDDPTFRTSTDFALTWLNNIPVGVDLSPIPAVILCELLDHELLRDTLAHHPSIERLRRTIFALHSAALDGLTVSPSQWREVRREAVRATDAIPVGITERAARVLEVAAWSHLTRSTLYDTMNAVSMMVNDKAMLDIGWSAAEEEATFAILRAIFEENASFGKDLFGDDLLCELTRRDPASGMRFAQRNAAMKRSRLVYTKSAQSILREFQSLSNTSHKAAAVE
jgi:hypothetical protein